MHLKRRARIIPGADRKVKEFYPIVATTVLSLICTGLKSPEIS